VSGPVATPLPEDALVAALEPLARRDAATIEVAGRPVRFTQARKALFPTGETKADLLAYLLTMAPVMLPHLADRPITLTRYPHGASGKSFFQKNRPAGAPPWLESALVGQTRFPLARTAAELALFAQWAAIEIHVPLCRLRRDGSLEVDQLVVDLDPMPPAGWAEAQRAARGVRHLLESVGVASYPKLSGQTAQVARGLATLLWRAAPDVYTIVWQVSRRVGVYVDHNQNAAGHTMAAAYGVRPSARARVSAPVMWDEVFDVTPDAFTIHTMPERVRSLGDLLAPALGPPEPYAPLEEMARDALGLRRAPAPGATRAGRAGPQAVVVSAAAAPPVIADATSRSARRRSSARL
jgi:bifunctional non-homologous end joining protein LigD